MSKVEELFRIIPCLVDVLDCTVRETIPVIGHVIADVMLHVDVITPSSFYLIFDGCIFSTTGFTCIEPSLSSGFKSGIHIIYIMLVGT